ncbi:MAG: hypothetical protein ABI353_19535 [Isosphaeraceae bacterium]
MGILQSRAVRASVLSACLGIAPGLALDSAMAGQHHRTAQVVTLVPSAAPVATYQYAPTVIQAAPVATYQYAPAAVQAAPVATYQYAPTAVQAAPVATYQYAPTAVQAAPTATYQYAQPAVQAAPTATYQYPPATVQAAPVAAAPGAAPLPVPGQTIRLSPQERMDIYQDLRADFPDLIGSERSRATRRQTLRSAARERYLDILTAEDEEVDELNEDEVADANSIADLILNGGAETAQTYGPIAPLIRDYQASARAYDYDYGYDYGPSAQGRRPIPVQPVQLVQPLVPLMPLVPLVPVFSVVPVSRHHLKHFHR